MSLDAPLHEEMKRRGSRAAIVWRAGDLLYYIGLLVGVAGPWPLMMTLLEWRFGVVSTLLIGLAVFVSGALVFLAGGSLKQWSYVLAKADGIDVTHY
jgi:fucose permease